MLPNNLIKPVRSAAILTGSYVAGTTLTDTSNYNQLSILVEYTKGSLTSVEIKVEFSYDGITYFQEANVETSSGTNTLIPSEYTYTGATGNFVIDIPISCTFIKISAKGTGTVTSSSLALNAILAWVG